MNDGGLPALRGPVRTWLRAEGAVECALAVAVYARTGGNWWWFALLFLAPDLSFLAYLRGPVFGAAAYNLVHSYVLPGVLLAFGLAGVPGAVPVALIWAAHIGFDRAIGYGLKDRAGFGFTHLGRFGRAAAGNPPAAQAQPAAGSGRITNEAKT
jgi:hypothetical protein